MLIGTSKVRIHAPWVHSLKEKRMVVKSICAKVRNKFNVSIAEIEDQDKHQIIVIGFAAVAGDISQCDSIIDHVLNFIEGNTEGEIIGIERDIV
ncbi:hypothetical protein EDD66_10677 [Mobilisporobacter senegalensis]|uniref:DUF503 domain-containing protein n=1 Tax=Mobilisporobacter senegalensis TaxID=1329262 RepID=A0A3N1XKZ5_9FIRM|nr:DUF503 domain-containing protein [Mobilisporobacter senegalensis]ROR27380.1 hypothetical protein EDD66_10677 [Mobilisporobacter senegalensis]